MESNDSGTVEENLGTRIKTLREEKGWTQRRLDKEAGFAHGYTSKLEKGRVQSPSLKMIERLSNALTVPISQFSALSAKDRAKGLAESRQVFTSDLAEIQAALAVIGNRDLERLAALKVIINDVKTQVELKRYSKKPGPK